MASNVVDGANVKLIWEKAPSACDSLSREIVPHHEHKMSNLSCGGTARCTFRRVSKPCVCVHAALLPETPRQLVVLCRGQ